MVTPQIVLKALKLFIINMDYVLIQKCSHHLYSLKYKILRQITLPYYAAFCYIVNTSNPIKYNALGSLQCKCTKYNTSTRSNNHTRSTYNAFRN